MAEKVSYLDPIQHTLVLPEGQVKISPQQNHYLLLLHDNPDGVPVRDLDPLMNIRRADPIHTGLAKVVSSSLFRLIADNVSAQAAERIITREQVEGAVTRKSIHRIGDHTNFHLILEKYGLHEGDDYYYMGTDEIDSTWDLIDLSNYTVSNRQKDVTLPRSARDVAFTQLLFRDQLFDLDTLNKLTNNLLETHHSVVKIYETIRRLAEATPHVQLNEANHPITTHIESAAKITGVIHKPGHRRIHSS